MMEAVVMSEIPQEERCSQGQNGAQGPPPDPLKKALDFTMLIQGPGVQIQGRLTSAPHLSVSRPWSP